MTVRKNVRLHLSVGRREVETLRGYLLPDECARAVCFAVAEGGKPRLADRGGRLRFNVAHSHDLMLCAVTLDHEVGIDVEHVTSAPVASITSVASPERKPPTGGTPRPTTC